MHTRGRAGQCMLTYGTVSRRKFVQDTADANLLLTVVVSGHNCVAVRCHTMKQCV